MLFTIIVTFQKRPSEEKKTNFTEGYLTNPSATPLPLLSEGGMNVTAIRHRVRDRVDTLKEKIKTNIKDKVKDKIKTKTKKKKNKKKKKKNKDGPGKTADANVPFSASTSTSSSSNNVNRRASTQIPTFPFLRLPRELRDRVYEELLTRPDHNEVWIRYSPERRTWWDATKFCLCYRRPGQDVSSTRTPPPLEVAILRTCRMVHDEASAILYGVGRYHCDDSEDDGKEKGKGGDKDGKRCCGGTRRKQYQIWLDAPPAMALEFLSTRLLPSSRRRIRFLKLWLDPYLDCHHATGGLDQLSPWKLIVHKRRVRHELLDPWKRLMTFLGDEKNMPMLSTLCVSLNAEWSWHVSDIGRVDRDWQHFYRTGWMEMLRGDNNPSGPDGVDGGGGGGGGGGRRGGFRALETLLVECRRSGFKAPVHAHELRSLNELRDDLAASSGFVEQEARWVSYMFGAGGFAPIEIPRSMLCLSLKRRKQQASADADNDDSEPRPTSSSSSSDGRKKKQNHALPPLEEFRQEYTWEDAYMPVICTFASSLPPRSPDNTR